MWSVNMKYIFHKYDTCTTLHCNKNDYFYVYVRLDVIKHIVQIFQTFMLDSRTIASQGRGQYDSLTYTDI